MESLACVYMPYWIVNDHKRSLGPPFLSCWVPGRVVLGDHICQLSRKVVSLQPTINSQALPGKPGPHYFMKKHLIERKKKLFFSMLGGLFLEVAWVNTLGKGVPSYTVLLNQGGGLVGCLSVGATGAIYILGRMCAHTCVSMNIHGWRSLCNIRHYFECCMFSSWHWLHSRIFNLVALLYTEPPPDCYSTFQCASIVTCLQFIPPAYIRGIV